MKRFVYIMVLTPVSILSILTMVYLFKLDEPLFFIKSVKVAGLKQVEYKDLMQRVSPYLRESIFRVDVSRIRKTLLVHPFIKDVRIKKVYPFSLVIAITERRPSAIWIDDKGKPSVLDEAGRPYRRLPKGKMEMRDVFIINAKTQGEAEGIYRQMLKWFEEGLIKREGISEVLYEEGDMTIFGVEDGVEIILGREDQKERLKRAMMVLDDAKKRGLIIRCIDARFERGAIIQERKG